MAEAVIKPSSLESFDPTLRELIPGTSRLHIMIAGGLGKSTGLKNIFGLDQPAMPSGESVIKRVVQVQQRNNDIFLTATEIPGLTAARTPEMKVIVRDMKKLGIKSSFLLILTLPVMPDYTINEDYCATLKTLTRIFGPTIWDWCLVLLTCSDFVRENNFPSENAQQQYVEHIKDRCTALQKELEIIGVKKTVKSFFEFVTFKQLTNEKVDGIVAIPVGKDPYFSTIRLLPLQPWTHKYKWTDLAYMTSLKLNKRIPKANLQRQALIQFRYGYFTKKDKLKAIAIASASGAAGGVVVGGATGAGIGAGAGTLVEPGGGTVLGGLLGGGIGAITGGITGAIGVGSGAAAIIMINMRLQRLRQIS